MKTSYIFLFSITMFWIVLFSCTTSISVKSNNGNAGTPLQTEPAVQDSLITIHPRMFNPSQKESVSIKIKMNHDAAITASIIDEDGFIIRHLAIDTALSTGTVAEFKWDGRDDSMSIVPDEAYFPFIIFNAKDKKDTINPILLSGGEDCEIQDVKYDPAEKAVSYKLKQPARVMVRAGIQKGALLSTIVDLKPRFTGSVSEYWNGMDNDNLFNIAGLNKQVSVAAFGYTLPQPVILTFGNNSTPNFRTYRKKSDTLTGKHFFLPDDSILGRATTLHFKQSRVTDYAPGIDISYLQNESIDSTGKVLLKGKTVVRTSINKNDLHFLNEQYEITFFLDHEFFTEEEIGYLPYNMVWDLSEISKGDHIFTVNIASFKDRIGVKSVKISVQ